MNLKYTLFKLLEMVFLSYTFPVTFSICTDFIGWIKMSSTSFSRIVFTGCFYKQVSLEGRDSPMLAVDLNSKVIKVLSLTLERWLGFFSSNAMGFIVSMFCSPAHHEGKKHLCLITLPRGNLVSGNKDKLLLWLLW